MPMTNTPGTNNGEYTKDARAAILAAFRDERDSGRWLAGVRARAVADLGSSDAVIASRPGSRGAHLIRQLVKGTVGWDDGCLVNFREPLR